MPYLRDVTTPDSPIGIYLSTRNGAFLTRAVLDLLLALEKSVGRGKAVLVVHDATKGVEAKGLSVKAYGLGEGVRGVAKDGKWDSAAYVFSTAAAGLWMSSCEGLCLPIGWSG